MITSPYPHPPITPPDEHPRVMLRAADLPRLRRNIESNPTVTAMWRELCETPLVRIGAMPEYGTYHLRDYLILEARALSCLLNPDAAQSRALIDDLRRTLEDFTVLKGHMAARWGGHLVFTAAQIYDWCYDALTREDKDAIIAACERISSAYFEMGYPPTRQMAISGHGGEAQLLRDLLAFAIAAYDERPDIYRFCAGRIFAEYVPEYNALFAAGVSPQGPSYGAYRYTCMLWSELLMRPLMGKPLYDCTEKMAQGLRYFRRPDGEALSLGDDFYATKSAHTRAHPFAVPMFLAYAATGRADLAAEADGIEGYLIPSRFGMDYYKDGSWGEGLISPVSYLILDGMIPPAPAQEILPYHYFGSPVGMTVWRDAERMILMKIGEYWGANHDHLDTGCFQILYRGTLTGDSGVYDGYHVPHRMHYLIRTCAHNCLTVRAPVMPADCGFASDAPNDGGTRRPCNGKEPRQFALMREHYLMARDITHSESPDELTIAADLTPAYAHTCERVTRRMAFYPGRGAHGLLEIRDEVTSLDPSYEKAFLLHCSNPPVIDGNTVTLESDGGRLICRVIEPADARITVIGGEGAEFVTDGTNYPTPAEHYDVDLGWGRVVISPATPAVTDRFHVKMEIADK